MFSESVRPVAMPASALETGKDDGIAGAGGSRCDL